jgi:hypothetical protein
MVALQFTLACPEMVRSLTLVDSYPYTPGAIQGAIEKWIADTEEKGYARVMETFNEDYAALSHPVSQCCPSFRLRDTPRLTT